MRVALAVVEEYFVTVEGATAQEATASVFLSAVTPALEW